MAIPFETEIDMQANKIVDQLDPTSAQDGATKNYVDVTAAANYILTVPDSAERNIIIPDAINYYGLIIEAMSGQSQSLLQIRDSSSTSVFNVAPTGLFTASASGVIQTANASVTALIAKGFTSQTAAIQQWQDSAASVVASVSAAGLGTFTGATVNGVTTLVGNVGISSGDLTMDGDVVIHSFGLGATVPLTVQGDTAQTADLQQWHNNAGTRLADIDAAGKGTFTGVSLEDDLDSTNSSIFFDYSLSRLGLGQNPSANALTVNALSFGCTFCAKAEGAADLAGISSHRFSDTATVGASYVSMRSRGTEASQTIVQDGDTLMSLTATGHDGTDYALSSQIVFKVEGTPGTDDMPGSIDLKVSPDGSQTPAIAMHVNSDKSIDMLGAVDITGAVTVSSTVDGRDVAADGTTLDSVKAAEYLALSTDATLTNERAFTIGDGLVGTDAGAGSTYTVSTQIPQNVLIKENTRVVNIPAALTELGNARVKLDLTNTSTFRISVQVSTAAAGGGITYLQYSTDESIWAQLGSNTISITTTGTKVTSFESVTAGAQGDVWIRPVHSGGNAVNDPFLGPYHLQLK